MGTQLLGPEMKVKLVPNQTKKNLFIQFYIGKIIFIAPNSSMLNKLTLRPNVNICDEMTTKRMTTEGWQQKGTVLTICISVLPVNCCNCSLLKKEKLVIPLTYYICTQICAHTHTHKCNNDVLTFFLQLKCLLFSWQRPLHLSSKVNPNTLNKVIALEN